MQTVAVLSVTVSNIKLAEITVHELQKFTKTLSPSTVLKLCVKFSKDRGNHHNRRVENTTVLMGDYR